MHSQRNTRILPGTPWIIHVGMDDMTAGVAASGAALAHADFQPPGGGDPRRVRMLTDLAEAPVAERVDSANKIALERFQASQPHLVGVGTALDTIPGMEEGLFLHAGPPIGWERMSGPLRGAVIGGALLEGLASTPTQAEALASSGAIRFQPCHAHQAVGPMAGLVTPSMPVWIVEDHGGHNQGKRSFCTLNEGLGKVLRYGAFSSEVLERLRFMETTLAPALAAALEESGPVDLKLLMAQALQMGDEGHNRNRAGTSLLIRELAPHLAALPLAREDLSRSLAFMHANDHFFLNLSMPMAKCMLMAAEDVPLSSMLTVMCRNGTDFGVQVASMPGRWFTGPAMQVRGLYFPGFSASDANPDIGDSAIMETSGIGGFAMAAAPAIVQFVGGTVADALATTRRMARITLGRNSTWAIPSLDFLGTPTGIDLLRVESLNLLPAINTGIAHREPGVGQVGAGLVSPPWECFHQALSAFHQHVMETIPHHAEPV